MKNSPKGTTIDTTNIQPGELIHTYFDLYNVTSIQGFTYMLTVVCEKNRMIWVFTNTSKIPPVQIIHFILIALNNEQHT